MAEVRLTPQDFWAVDFEDELSALSGDLLLSQVLEDDPGAR